MFSASVWRWRSFLTSVSASDVRGSWFIVRVSSALNSSWGERILVGNFGKTISMNLQFANLALRMVPILGMRYLMILGELNSKYMPCCWWELTVFRLGSATSFKPSSWIYEGVIYLAVGHISIQMGCVCLEGWAIIEEEMRHEGLHAPTWWRAYLHEGVKVE